MVGVDGSDGANQALRYALSEARAKASTVRAVLAWHVPATAFAGGYVPPVFDVDAFSARAREGLGRFVEAVADDAEGVEVEQVVREGQAAHVLVEEARETDADLLVVGSRGLGGFKGLLLGSVSQECAHHTPCPLVIVPNRDESEPATSTAR